MDDLSNDNFFFDEDEALEELRLRRLREKEGKSFKNYGRNKSIDTVKTVNDYSKPLDESSLSLLDDKLEIDESLDDALPDFEFSEVREPSYTVPNFPENFDDNDEEDLLSNYLDEVDDVEAVSNHDNDSFRDEYDDQRSDYSNDSNIAYTSESDDFSNSGFDSIQHNDALDSNEDYVSDDSSSESIATLSNDEEILNSLMDVMSGFDDEGVQHHKESFQNSSFAEPEEDEDLKGFNLDEVISVAIERGASDIHITPGDTVSYTINGSVYRVEQFGVIEPIVTETLHRGIISNVLEAEFVDLYSLDASYVVRTGRHRGRRLRLALGKANHGQITMEFRVISDNIPKPSELGITGSLLDWVKLPNGLVMMNGPTGTGKSSTLASLVKEIQRTRREKIITVEKPIEYVFGNDGLGIVVQREVGVDARSFSAALDLMMREAPNIIVVGEVRNRNEVEQLLRAAETGHLVISTMHTNSAAETINRISSLFSGDDQKRILRTLGDISRGFANQVLVPTLDGKGRFAVREVLDINLEVSEMIANADTRGIKNYQMRNKITMEHMLVNSVIEGKCTIDGARSKSSNPFLFDKIIKEYM